MERHESISDEFISKLEQGFLQEAEKVKSAANWDEAQKRMQGGTYPYLTAISRVKQGWDTKHILEELQIRRSLGAYPELDFIGFNEPRPPSL